MNYKIRLGKVFSLIIAALLFGSLLSALPVDNTTEVIASSSPDKISFAGGSGTEADPYLIGNVTHLQDMNTDLAANYALANDIDASETAGWNSDAGFDPVGSSSSSFTGTFDGRNHTITGLHIDRGSSDYVGLFGQIQSNGEVKYVELVDVDVRGRDRVGGLVGYNNEATVSACYADGIVSGNRYVGGLVGENYGENNNGVVSFSYANCEVSGVDTDIGGLIGYNYVGTVYNSFADGDVSGNENVGGLVGHNYEGTYWPGIVEKCYATGEVNGELVVGGLVGYNDNGEVNNSYATGDVIGNSTVGGLVGHNYWTQAEVLDSYATGKVTGNSTVGGLIGENSGWAAVSNSYWNTETTGQATSADGTGLTTSNMTWSYSGGAYNGWDMEPLGTHTNEAWKSGDHMMVFDHEGNYGYPALGWEENIGTEECPYHITNWYELDAVGDFLGNSFVVDNDLSGTTDGYDEIVETPDGFMPIGNSSDPFGGDFDGRNFTILDLYIDRNETDYVGLFGNINESATIRNLGMENANVTGRTCVGTLTGQNNGMIKNSHAVGYTCGETRVGGLVGRNRGTVDKTYADVNVDGNDTYIGGLAGTNSLVSVVKNSCALGDVNGYKYVGGLNGANYGTDTSIIDSYATGDVNGGIIVGGNVGYNNGGTVNRSYAAGKVNGTSSVGGLVGDNRGPVSESYATCEVTGENVIGGFIGHNSGGNATNSYARGNVTRKTGSTNTDIGGFVGRNNQGKVIKCYSTGSVSYDGVADPTDKGFAGSVDTGGSYEMIENFWDVDTSGQTNTAGNASENTTHEMMTKATFTDYNWDFDTIWGIFNSNTYPFLRTVEETPEVNADMEISLADSEDPILVGHILTYNVTITNHGPDNADGFYVNVTLPENVTFIDASEPGLTPTNGRYIHRYVPDTMYSGETGYALINVSIDGHLPATRNCTVSLNSSTPDAGDYPNETYELTEVNRPPVAEDDSNHTIEDTILTMNAPGVLKNDSDPDGHTLTLVDNGPSKHGASITLDADGSMVYDPTSSTAIQELHDGESLTDTFNYTVSDGNGGMDNASITVQVDGVDGLQTAVNDTYTIDEDSGSNVIDVLANDYPDEEGDPLEITQTSRATHGSVTISGNGKNLTYEPDSNYSGYEEFDYTISDGDTADTASVNVTILQVNDPPEAFDHDFTIDEDSGVNTFDVLTSATDIENDDILITDITQPEHGTTEITDDGKNLTYEPDLNFYGDDSFNYTISDGNGGTDTQSVKVEVSEINDPPILNITGLPDGEVGEEYYISLEATDLDSDRLTWMVTSEQNWTDSEITDSYFKGTPTESGTFWVNITVSDSEGGSDSSSFNIAISEIPDDETNDTDGDGVPDDQDEFPNDANETEDTDGDGVGDNADEFPEDPGETTDTDGDGVGDNSDDFPEDPAASTDTDEDGKPDEWNDGYTAEDSTTGLTLDDDPSTPTEGDGESGDSDYGDNMMLYVGIIIMIAVISIIALMSRSRGKETGEIQGSEEIEEEEDLFEEGTEEEELFSDPENLE